jgi:hypothetical protein
MEDEKKNNVAAYFEKYPDVPKEVILKEDIMRLGLRFTEEALKAAEGFREKVYFQFAWDRAPAEGMEKRENLRVPNDIRFSGGPYGLQPILTRVPINPKAPYLIDVINGKVVLCEEGIPIADAYYPARPKYYSLTFDDGTLYRDIAPISNGGTTLFVQVYPACQFWGSKEECKFCDINETSRQRNKFGFTRVGPSRVEYVAEAVAAAFKEAAEVPLEKWGFNHLAGYHISGGTILKEIGGLNEIEFYSRYVRAIKDKAGNRWPCLLQIGALEEDDYKRLRDAGVDAVHSNPEVWGKDLFRVVCPGKDKYVGWDEWIKRVVKSVDIFGEGNVNPNFVAGVEMAKPFGFKDVDEAVKSTSEGFEYLMSRGVVCRYNSWCVEPLSALGGQEPPPLDYFVKISKAWYELWKKYDLPPINGYGPIGIGRSSWYHASHYDWGLP